MRELDLDDFLNEISILALMRTFGWILFVFFAFIIGLYPFAYFLFDMSYGLLSSKSKELLADTVWNFAFYQHIIFGGIALMVGWSQFSKKFRSRNLSVHKAFGKVYLIDVLLSGSAGLYIAFYATGGIIAQLGFVGLAISWLFTSGTAYYSIRAKNVDRHEEWMIRSYALAFAAVTLRIWLPLFQFGFGIDFITAYVWIAWLCWVPNLLVAELIVQTIHKPKVIV